MPSLEAAERIANRLLDERSAACVQIAGPVVSRYRWRGTRERSEEWTCTIKTRASLVDAVANAIAEVHPYDTPELLVVPVTRAGAGYAEWIDAETDGPD